MMWSDIPLFYNFIILLAVYILGPIIPAVIIYKVAPDRPITAQGNLSNVNFKAGGAFAAYVVVVVFSSPIMLSAKADIESCRKREVFDVSWKIKANIKFRDFNSNKKLDNFEARDFLKSLQMNIKPELQNFNSNILIANIPESFIKDAVISFDINQPEVMLEPSPIELGKTNSKYINHTTRVIDLQEITLNVRKSELPLPDNMQRASVRTVASPPPSNAKSPPPQRTTNVASNTKTTTNSQKEEKEDESQ